MLNANDLRKDTSSLVIERDELRELVRRMLPYLTPPDDPDDEVRYMKLRRELRDLYQRDDELRCA
jgi:hypothetical protein